MAAPCESQTLSIWINRPIAVVYAFVAAPENFSKWATGLGESIRQLNGEWVAETAQGLITIRFTEPNSFGVLDHYITPASGAEIYIPMRVLPNGPGSELIFMLFRLPDMSDENFAEDAAWVTRDLKTLKDLLET